jgi:predicted phage terminase large subunit-like protein
MDPVGDKVMRMAAQSAKIEAGLVCLPRRASWLGEFQRELMGFPRGNTDDQVDALSQALAYNSRQRGGWGTVKGLV